MGGSLDGRGRVNLHAASVGSLGPGSGGAIGTSSARVEDGADRAREALGWTPRTPLDEGMRQYLGWIAANGPQ